MIAIVDGHWPWTSSVRRRGPVSVTVGFVTPGTATPGKGLQFKVEGVRFGEVHLFEVREPGCGRGGLDLDGTDLDPGAAAVAGRPGDWDLVPGLVPGQGVELVERAGLVPAGWEEGVGAAAVWVAGVSAVHRIRVMFAPMTVFVRSGSWFSGGWKAVISVISLVLEPASS
ncbi:hypothetical protein [Acrocarpospora macrocephala]|uniref:hypothetical protein n=1 Tax=Acrocarpospora macrocephala TaxID=150177 RepID=UPI0012D36838|nr:hypothetical protein [Acrocarpospora macrocephala]